MNATIILRCLALAALCLPACGAGGESETDCSEAKCPALACAEGQFEVFAAGACCATCSGDRKVNCKGGKNICDKGCAPSYQRVVLSADCCVCKPKHCDVKTCPQVTCGDNAELTLPSGSCCPACAPKQSKCKSNHLDCKSFVCSTGYKAEQTSDGCCSHCTADPAFCAKERAAFEADFKTILTDEATACSKHEDCTRLMASNKCRSACFGAGVSKASAQAVAAKIDAYVEANCSHCPQVSMVCASIYQVPQCNNGHCQ